MNKRGLSPVALTSILIIFAIVFGILMTFFGKTAAQAQPSCNVDVGLSFTIIADEEQICFDGSSIQFTVENGPNSEINSLMITINEQNVNLPDLKIGKVASYVGNVPFTGKVDSVTITPNVAVGGEIQSCSRESITMKNIRSC